MTTHDDITPTDDPKFEAFVRRAAIDHYQVPTEVPREAMWTAITARRAEARYAAARRRQRTWYVVGLAATLIIGVGIGEVMTRRTAAGPVDDGRATASTSYDVAAQAHLVRAEAMLTSFTTASGPAASDSAIGRWARDLLVNTRLLLDSPVGADATRRALLEDLERVLVQIVQRTPAETEAEVRAHVGRSIDRTHMLLRLRASQSAALTSGS